MRRATFSPLHSGSFQHARHRPGHGDQCVDECVKKVGVEARERACVRIGHGKGSFAFKTRTRPDARQRRLSRHPYPRTSISF